MNKRHAKKYMKNISSLKATRISGMSITLIHQTGGNYDGNGIPHYLEKRKIPIVHSSQS